MPSHRATRACLLVLALLAVPAPAIADDPLPIDRRITLDVQPVVLVGESALVQGNVTIDGEPAPLQQVWIFVDGEGKASTFTDRAGSYVVTLEIGPPGIHQVRASTHDPTGVDTGLEVYSSQQPVEVDARPEAAFSIQPETPTEGETVTFTDESTDADGSVVAWSWSFGDGTTSDEENPSHVYDTGGIYSVELTVTDDEGYKGTVAREVEVEPRPDTLEVGIDRVHAERSGNSVLVTVAVEGRLSGDGEGLADRTVEGEVTLTADDPCWGSSPDSTCATVVDQQTATFSVETDEDGTFWTTVTGFEYAYVSSCDEVDVGVSASYDGSDGTATGTASQTDVGRCV